jgi:hypothetical protein
VSCRGMWPSGRCGSRASHLESDAA